MSAVGWVQNTVPAQKKGIIELPMTDVAGAGFAVGASLANIRPIFILRSLHARIAPAAIYSVQHIIAVTFLFFNNG